MPTPMAMAKLLVEAARAAALATHSAAGLCCDAGPQAREALRLLRCAESLARAAIVSLQKPPLKVVNDMAEEATKKKTRKRIRRKKQKDQVPVMGAENDPAKQPGLDSPLDGSAAADRFMIVDAVGASPPLRALDVRGSCLQLRLRLRRCHQHH